MRIERHDEPSAFFSRVAGFLEGREAEHNVILGFRTRLEADPHAFGPADPRLLAVVNDEDDVVAVATQTPPFGIVLSEIDEPAAVDALADALASQAATLPTVLGPVAAARRFAERWSELTGAAAVVQTEERIYEATSVVPPKSVSGAPRRYAAHHRDLAVEWLRAFSAEALPEGAPFDAERFVDRRASGDGSLVLWEDGGRVVSLAGHAADTPNGARVGPVYTPPELRGRGYASALTAALTSDLLATRRFCFLLTDLANPTSNSIYQTIGYRPVTDVTLWAFGG